MIILNKRKDYYDYLTGVYGVDTKKVLDRKKDISSEELPFTESFYRSPWLLEQHNTYAIYIANRKYIVEQTGRGVWELHFFHKVDTNYRGSRLHKLGRKLLNKRSWDSYIESDYNKKCGRVLSISKVYHEDKHLIGKSPILSSFGFSAVLSPTEVYSEIDMMLGWHVDNPCKVGELDDKGKLLANGFDDKVSFRHRK